MKKKSFLQNFHKWRAALSDFCPEKTGKARKAVEMPEQFCYYNKEL